MPPAEPHDGAPAAPGVDVNEEASFPAGIVGVATAVACFIGPTAVADDAGRSLAGVATPIGSIDDFERLFGGAAVRRYRILPFPGADETSAFTVTLGEGRSCRLVDTGGVRFHLPDAVRAFFAHGGERCFVVSTGGGAAVPGQAVAVEPLLAGIATAAGTVEPTMLLVPDAVLLSPPDRAAVIAAMLAGCAANGDRMAILDVAESAAATTDGGTADIAAFRAAVAAVPVEQRRYGAAYFPYLIVGDEPAAVDLSLFDPAGLADLRQLLSQQAADLSAPKTLAAAIAAIALIGTTVARPKPADEGLPPDPDQLTDRALSDRLAAVLPAYRRLLDAIAARRWAVPPSGTMAGLWAANDRAGGVWKTPANVAVAGAVPRWPIDDRRQASLTEDGAGLSINAIRGFVTRGTLVWGGRTLDGLSNDWRYIAVRRTISYVEQSIREGLRSLVFAPNTAPTWATAAASIRAFLHDLWATGGLAGGTSAEAFAVAVGLGTTMAPQDILDGWMHVSILVSVAPDHRIELTFTQAMAVAG